VNLYPAIDIMDGKAVRLVKGDFQARKVYDEDPLEAARKWVNEDARHLHVVDLDGARAGHPVNLRHVRRIAAELGVPVQLGGGLRTLEAIAEALQAGAERVILGTAAFTGSLLEQALQAHGPERVMVSVDVREGKVSIEGWTKAAEEEITEVFANLVARGVTRMLYTNVDRDGMLEGQSDDDVAWAARGVGPAAQLIYSGGIGSLEDLTGLVDLNEPSLTGVIVGKALYEGRFTVAAARAALGEDI
jgi:phosphoribosylformimino-5-aminoimidazole carboxamide ribotide isomerase